MNKSNRLHIVFLVSNDLCYDQRVQRHASVMQELGHNVLLLGRLKKSTNRTIEIPFPHKRFKLFVEKSALFYACLNIRFFIFLLFSRYDIIWANDLDTLPAAYFVSKIKRNKLFYDSHEFFTGVPELVGRNGVLKFWTRLERYLLPKLTTKITVNKSVAALYKDAYAVRFEVVRNISSPALTSKTTVLPNITGFSYKEPFLIYQGAVNKDRGLEEVIDAMQAIHQLNLLIVGNGDVLEQLKNQVTSLGLNHKVFFAGALSPVVLQQITPLAFAGLSLEKPTNINYTYCLPNKLFDYIHAEIPVIAYPNPEVKALVEQYEIGTFINNHTPEEVARVFNELVKHQNNYNEYKNKTKKAKEVLNWKTEAEHLLAIFEGFLKC